MTRKLYLLTTLLFYFVCYINSIAQPIISYAPNIKTFATDGELSSSGAKSVNLSSGDVSFPINLITLPGHNGLSVNVTINYNSNVQNNVGTWNLDAPTGTLGLGWNLNFPKIVCDHKQTGTREDDDFYLIDEGGLNKLIYSNVIDQFTDNEHGSFKAKNYQFWRIEYFPKNEMWKITKEDGTVYNYGDIGSVNNTGGNRNTVQNTVRWGNWIGNSSGRTNNQTQTYEDQIVTTWNLSEVINKWNEKITFEYQNDENFVGNPLAAKLQTEASYIKQITDVQGRVILFNYLDKASFKPNNIASEFYMEPHTETNEPDGYQEYYERKYLDRIDVLDETGKKALNVQMSYGILDEGTNMAKMLLTGIIQKNKDGNSLPGINFSYKQSGNIKGFLEKTTYPTGGSVTYTYNEVGITLGHSKKQYTDASGNPLINAPAGYAEPQFYVSNEDYVVVTWRALNTDGTHDSGKKPIIFKVYQWVGEWIEVNYDGINNLYGIFLDNKNQYQKFQVVLKKDFFAVLGQSDNSPDYYTLSIFYKDETIRGHWITYNPPQSFYRKGDADPILLAGDKFIAVGVQEGDLYTYTFIGDDWREQLTSGFGHYSYTATNNFIVRHNTTKNTFAGDNTDKLSFIYLGMNGLWIVNVMTPAITSSGESHWYSNNSFVMGITGDNQHFIFGWDANFISLRGPKNFRRYDNVFGSLQSPALIHPLGNNSFTYTYNKNTGGGWYSVDFKVARFNGDNWDFVSGSNCVGGHIIDDGKSGMAYGDDYIMWYEYASDFKSSIAHLYEYTGYSWHENQSFISSSPINPLARAGNNFFAAKKDIYFKNPNGTLKSMVTSYTPKFLELHITAPHFFIYYGDSQNPYPSLGVSCQLVKNGSLFGNPTYITGDNDPNNPYKESSGAWKEENEFQNGNNLVTAIPISISYYTLLELKDLKQFILTRIQGTSPSLTYQIDYPVIQITENDGKQDRATFFEYNASTATIDASGNTAQYNEVTISKDNKVTKPYGSTKHFFYNGIAVNVALEKSLKLIGSPYLTTYADNLGNIVSSQTTSYLVFANAITNSEGNKVETGYYTRPVSSSNYTDGVTSISASDYDFLTGLVKSTVLKNFDSKSKLIGGSWDNPNNIITNYTYFWEKYDPTRSLNILSPVIQTTKSITNSAGSNLISVSSTTWRTWGTNNAWASHKSYTWKNTGSSDFNFTNWSGTGEPTSDWIKVSEVKAIDAKGNISQITTR